MLLLMIARQTAIGDSNRMILPHIAHDVAGDVDHAAVSAGDDGDVAVDDDRTW